MALIKKTTKTDKNKVKKNKPKEFFDALVYAAIVAFIIKIFLFEAYRIPTGSMENTLLVGDFLLVTKFTYGATTPRNVPFTDIRIPYWKLPGFKDPERGDIIVFDFPGDKDELESKEVVNYIKRCVGLPGDTIHVVDKQLYVNGAIFPNPPNSQFDKVQRGLDTRNARIFPKGAPWTEDNYGPIRVPKKGDKIALNDKNFDQWRMFALKEGHRIQLNPGGVISSDGVNLPNNEYTVERNYLFMMGDNRNNSLDSRFWGFMPEQNIVGQAFMLYWSWDANIPFSHFFDLLGSIRWGRIGNLIR
ncbi:MAG: signal peptidase I [Bacteroidetes bacterium]|nr:signal peptidase I [Bacteroidota bacterium]